MLLSLVSSHLAGELAGTVGTIAKKALLVREKKTLDPSTRDRLWAIASQLLETSSSIC